MKNTRQSFEEHCYGVLKSVPKGKVTTYSSIARAFNSRACRAVGAAMKKNRDITVPCHRVVLSSGEVGNYNRGRATKERILRSEGVKIVDGKINLGVYSHKIGKGR
jgi:methylated-DNA-[protein]-cysteine S-methyltransferase